MLIELFTSHTVLSQRAAGSDFRQGGSELCVICPWNTNWSWWTNRNALRNLSYNIWEKDICRLLCERVSNNQDKRKIPGWFTRRRKTTTQCSFEHLLVVHLIVLIALSNLIMPFSLWEFISTSFSELTDLSSWFCFVFFYLKPTAFFFFF